MRLDLFLSTCKGPAYGILVHTAPYRRRKGWFRSANKSLPKAQEDDAGTRNTPIVDYRSQCCESQPSGSVGPSDVLSNTNPATALGSSLLAAPHQQAAGFFALTAASLAFAAAALATPDSLLSVAVGGDHGVLDAAFTRIAGATMLISAAVEYSVQDAVTAGHLKSTTYQRLLLIIAVKDVLYMAAFVTCPSLWSPLLLVIYGGSAGASLLVTAATLRVSFKQSGAASAAEGVAAAFGGRGLPKSRAGWAYSVFTLLYMATAAACYAPEVIFTGEPMTVTGELLKHTWAPGFLLAAAACWVLSDAADRGRLAASTFKRLNLGLAGVEAGYTAVFAWSVSTGLAVSDASSLSNLAGSVGITLYCMYQYVSNSQSR